MDSNKLDETPSTARPFQKLRQLRPCGGGDCEGVKEAPTDEEENRCNVELGNVPIRSRRREHSVFTCSGVQSGRARRPATGTLNAKTSSSTLAPLPPRPTAGGCRRSYERGRSSRAAHTRGCRRRRIAAPAHNGVVCAVCTHGGVGRAAHTESSPMCSSSRLASKASSGMGSHAGGSPNDLSMPS